MNEQCSEQINQRRQQLCSRLNKKRSPILSKARSTCSKRRVLVIVQLNWHHGVISIVASRLVDRVPVFIGTYEDEHTWAQRGIQQNSHVFEALNFCKDLLGKFGGHSSWGLFFWLHAEFGMPLRSACSTLPTSASNQKHLAALKIDAQANLNQTNRQLYNLARHLHPCGIKP